MKTKFCWHKSRRFRCRLRSQRGESPSHASQNMHDDSCAWSQQFLYFELSDKLDQKKKTSQSGAEPPLLGYFGAQDPGADSESDYFSSFALGLKYLTSSYCETFGRVILSSTFLFFADSQSPIQQKGLSGPIKGRRDGTEWPLPEERPSIFDIKHLKIQSIKAACTEASAPKWPPSI